MNIKFFSNELDEGVHMTKDDFKHICENMKFQFCRAGEVVMRKGDYGNTFYMIIQGTV